MELYDWRDDTMRVSLNMQSSSEAGTISIWTVMSVHLSINQANTSNINLSASYCTQSIPISHVHKTESNALLACLSDLAFNFDWWLEHPAVD